MGICGKHDKQLEQKVRRAIRAAVADGSPADQAALKKMAGADLPQCKEVSRDKAHSLRSCLRRPCARMGPEAQAVFAALVDGPESAVRIIDNSDAHRDTWQRQGSLWWNVRCKVRDAS